jgi:hypothetical protein
MQNRAGHFIRPFGQVFLLVQDVGAAGDRTLQGVRKLEDLAFKVEVLGNIALPVIPTCMMVSNERSRISQERKFAQKHLAAAGMFSKFPSGFAQNGVFFLYRERSDIMEERRVTISGPARSIASDRDSSRFSRLIGLYLHVISLFWQGLIRPPVSCAGCSERGMRSTHGLLRRTLSLHYKGHEFLVILQNVTQEPVPEEHKKAFDSPRPPSGLLGI